MVVIFKTNLPSQTSILHDPIIGVTLLPLIAE